MISFFFVVVDKSEMSYVFCIHHLMKLRMTRYSYILYASESWMIELRVSCSLHESDHPVINIDLSCATGIINVNLQSKKSVILSCW